MIRSLFFAIKIVLYTIYLVIPLARVTNLSRLNKLDQKDAFISKTASVWSKRLVKWTGSTVEVVGSENIPKTGGVLFVGNHQSNMDIPILMANIERPKGFIAKLELKKIPILSVWMDHIGCLFMDRGNPRQSLKVINEAAEVMKNGYALVIFPEGTRSKDGTLGEFKSGSLKPAIKAKVPIVPITLIGSGNIMPKGTLEIRPTNVKIIISEPINLADIGVIDSNDITATIRNTILQNLEKASL